MSFSFGIQALHPATGTNKPHIHGFGTPRAGTDTLAEWWNGATSASRKVRIESDGKIVTSGGVEATTGAFSGAVTLSSTLAVTEVATFTARAGFAAGIRLGSGSTPAVLGSTATLADLATEPLTSLSGGGTFGILFVNSSSDGLAAIFLVQGGNAVVNLISDPGSAFSNTAGTANRINVYWSAGNARYEVENRRGGSRLISAAIIA